MAERKDALERLDLKIRWGHYNIRVLRFHLTSFEPGKVIQFHKHVEFEFHFIPRGKGKVILGDQEYELSEGLLYLTGPGVMHYQEASAEEAMDELCLHVEITESEPISTSEATVSDILDHHEIAEADDCIDRLKQLPLIPVIDRFSAMPCFLESYMACYENSFGSYTTIKSQVIQILLRTVRAYDNGNPLADLPVRDMKSSRYQFVIQYLRANYATPVTQEDLAEKLHISTRQLQRIMKDKHPGQSFSKIVEEIRLDAVCRRLVESDLTVENIAMLEGFSNPTYLHSVFRKRFGITPAQYRGSSSVSRI